MGAHKYRKPARLGRASAYYRLAAKAEKAGNQLKAQRYREIADGLVAEEHTAGNAQQPLLRVVRDEPEVGQRQSLPADEINSLLSDLGILDMPDP